MNVKETFCCMVDCWSSFPHRFAITMIGAICRAITMKLSLLDIYEVNEKQKFCNPKHYERC